MSGNTQKGCDVVFDLFPQGKTIVRYIYHNKLSIVNPNKEGKEYDHVYSTTIQYVDGILYEPLGETEDNEEGEKNDPKDGGGIMKKSNIPA